MSRILEKVKKIIPKPIFTAMQPAYHFCLSCLAAFIYGKPSNNLIVIGITGTTGKTTSVFLIAKMLERAGCKVGFTSTAAFNDGQKEWLNDKKMTMVGRFFTQKVLKRMVANGCEYAIVETTSEGIRQYRHRFINYDSIIFTGLYPEHIESHGSFEKYKQAKGKLFEYLSKCQTKYVDENNKICKAEAGIKKIGLNRIKKTIIANLDDEHADYFLGFRAEKKIGYTKDGKGKSFKETIKDIEIIEYSKVESSSSGTSFIVWQKEVNLALLGAFNATNAMNAISVGKSIGMEAEKVIRNVESIRGVSGRLEVIDEGQDFTVIVDYAFEPTALEGLYRTLSKIPHNEIIHVLGSAGGGRDVGRRPVLGKIAGKNANYVIVTDEDPYDDDPAIIIDQVALGVEHAGKEDKKDLFKILNRREAIKKAIKLANKNDIIIITGKGSEQAICRKNGEKETWDDRAVVRAILLKNKK